jgi:hypothetical protein
MLVISESNDIGNYSLISMLEATIKFYTVINTNIKLLLIPDPFAKVEGIIWMDS